MPWFGACLTNVHLTGDLSWDLLTGHRPLLSTRSHILTIGRSHQEDTFNPGCGGGDAVFWASTPHLWMDINKTRVRLLPIGHATLAKNQTLDSLYHRSFFRVWFTHSTRNNLPWRIVRTVLYNMQGASYKEIRGDEDNYSLGYI